MAAPVIQRKIYFYRADIGQEPSGKLKPVDVVPALEQIGQLVFRGTQGRYKVGPDGDALGVFGHSTSPTARLIFGRVRRSGLPQIEESGSISDLNIAADAGLLERIHVVFFSDNVVGVEYNHFGPRISSLGDYLHERSSGAVRRIDFRLLMRKNALSDMRKLEDIRLIDIKIRPHYLTRIEEADIGLADAFKANEQLHRNPDALSLVIQPSREDQESMWYRLREALRYIVRLEPTESDISKFKIRGRFSDTGRVDTIDVMNDHLVSTRRVVKQSARGRAVDSTSAYEEIELAYVELKDEIAAAVDLLT